MAPSASLEQEQVRVFADVLQLSSLFSNCVEAIGLIVPYHEGRKTENGLLAKVGIQQDRLLCWGDVLGITSPPQSSGITQAIPRHAGLTNPDPTQPINFASRDARLDDVENRTRINEALHGFGDPILMPDHIELRKTYGLRHFKGSRFTEQPFVSILRLEAFREKVSLLEDVTGSFEFPDLPRKKNRQMMPRWYIEDHALFEDYLKALTENIDYLIRFMDVQPQVDKSTKMDLRAMGWHPSDQQFDIARMGWKLGVIREASVDQYPEYSAAAKEAQDNTLGIWKGTESYLGPDDLNPVIESVALHTPDEVEARLVSLKAGKQARPSIFGKFLRRRSAKPEDDRRKSHDGSPLSRSSKAADAKRSNSYVVKTARDSLDPPRSQSVHAMTEKELNKSKPSDEGPGLQKMPTNTSAISRHDMYTGLYRLDSKK